MTIDLTNMLMMLLPMVVFCIGIYFLVLCIRYLVEVKRPDLSKNPGWKKILRVMPPLFGGILAVLMDEYPFLDKLPTWSARFIYGCFGGGIASFTYMVFKAAVQRWLGVKVEKRLSDSDAPPMNKDR